MRLMILFLLASACVATPEGRTAAAEPLQYNRDIRPILSNKCFRCHGPDAQAREAELRLDVRDMAIAPRSGNAAIAAGRPQESEIMHRITADDPSLRMPPVDSNLSLSHSEIETIRRWIAEGAEYQTHWSFIAPQAAELPRVTRAEWCANSIDRFVLAELESTGVAPSRPADKETLIRRVTLDLTGLPPTVEEIDAFLADNSADAYEKLVDRLLASPRFGERMAIEWLDGARYADTNGYFSDFERQVWPWRAWVIRAFNANQPFDQFTIDQLAGDLLASPTTAQRVATGFNRNYMVSNETGIIDEEYRVQYVSDRLETAATVWMGLTVGCARCHDHKYDPISIREYYQLFAFFNNLAESGLVSAQDPPPVLEVATSEQHERLAQLEQTQREAEAAFAPVRDALREPIAAWENGPREDLQLPQQQLLTHVRFEPDDPTVSAEGTINFEPGLIGRCAELAAMQHLELSGAVPLDEHRPWSVGLWIRPTGSLNCILAKMEPGDQRRGFELLWQKGRLQINLVARWGVDAICVRSAEALTGDQWRQVIVSYDGSMKADGVGVYVDGQPVALDVTLDSLTGTIANQQPLRIGRRDNGLGYYGKLDELRIFRCAVDAQQARQWFWSERLTPILAIGDAERDEAQRHLLLEYYLLQHAGEHARAVYAQQQHARQAADEYRKQLPKTLVMEEMPQPRATYVLQRGQYNQRGEQVEANVPAIFPPLDDSAPRNRLGFAQWLVSPHHPLTARVAVNRLWKQCFGEGLVRTAADFGLQGELPTHGALLDWLAVDFQASGWDQKRLLRQIVLSSTYRQSSIPAPELLARDPDNRLLARGPRFRLPAELIRDQALSLGGLLIERVGGPSVKPYQPPGLWEAVSYDGDLTYVVDQGAGLWRRSIYTFWKRQSPPPSLLLFDSPTRETCVVQRARTNTPLQALVLLNDVTYVEAARSLAAIVLHHSADDGKRLHYAVRRTTSRRATDHELAILLQLLQRQRSHFAEHPEHAAELLTVGRAPVDAALDPCELASWTATMQMLLNLDELVTRR